MGGPDPVYISPTRDFVHTSRERGVTPHVAQSPETDRRGSAIDGRTTRHAGYDVSQRKRKLVEPAFGWMKTVGLLRTLHHRGGPLVEWVFTFHFEDNVGVLEVTFSVAC